MKLQLNTKMSCAIAALALCATVGGGAQAAGSGTWTLTGSLATARESHTATVLPNGYVLAAGGETDTNVTQASELYNSGSGAWTPTGNLAVARAGHQAVLLASGQVLVAGGCVKTCAGGNTASAELYNPSNGTWTTTASMATARVYFGMVPLANGTVLAVGGCTGQNANGCSGVSSAAEIYDPSSGKWTPTGSLHTARGAFTTTVMQNGYVLVAGGINASNNPMTSCEKYSPASGSWTVSGQMKVARDEHTATLLPNGQILVAGGENGSGVSTAKAELYNPSTKAWSLTGSMSGARLEHTALLLANGKVLVSGGNKVTVNNTTVLSSAEIFDPSSNTWSATGAMNSARVGHSSTLLSSGLVLNAGGSNGVNELSSTELYQP